MVAGIPAGPIIGLGERAFHIGIGQLHAFGMAGRAGGVKLDEIIIRLIVELGVLIRPAIAPRLKGGPIIMPAIHGDDLFDSRTIGQNALNQRHEILADKDHFGFCIIQHISDFRTGKPRIDTDQNAAHFLHTEKKLEIKVRIGPHKSDARMRFDVGAQKLLRHLIGKTRKRAIAGHAVFINQGRFVALRGGLRFNLID